MGRYVMGTKPFAGLGQTTIPNLNTLMNQFQQANTLMTTDNIAAGLDQFRAGADQLMNSISGGDWQTMAKTAVESGCSAALASVGASAACSLIGPIWDGIESIFAVEGNPYRDFLRWCCEVAGIPFSKDEKTCQRLAKLYEKDWDPQFFGQDKVTRDMQAATMKQYKIPFHVRAGSTAYWERPERTAPGWSDWYGDWWEVGDKKGQYYGYLTKTTEYPKSYAEPYLGGLRDTFELMCLNKASPEELFRQMTGSMVPSSKVKAMTYTLPTWLRMLDRLAAQYSLPQVTPSCIRPKPLTITYAGPMTYMTGKQKVSKGMSTPAKVALGVGGAGILFFIARKLLVKV